jgi:hypothetical protein
MKSTHNKKLEDMWEFCNDAFDTPEDLTTFLEISMEDLIMAFPEKLVELHPKIFVPLDEDGNDIKEKRQELSLWDDPGTEEDLWD